MDELATTVTRDEMRTIIEAMVARARWPELMEMRTIIEATVARARWPELMDGATAAAYLGVSPNTVYLWRKRHGLPFCEIPSVHPRAETRGPTHILRYRRRDVDRWTKQFRRVGCGETMLTGGGAAG